MTKAIGMFILIFCSLSFRSVHAAEGPPLTYVVDTDELIIFGHFTVASVDGMLTKLAASGLDKTLTGIRIRSPGGDVIAAMTFGNWVADRALDVVVMDFCMSACANYVFTAGRKKIISPGAAVAWHGGASISELRAIDNRYQALEQRRSSGEALSDDEKAFIKTNAFLHIALTKAWSMESALFKKLGTAEYLVRAGREPEKVSKLWTLTPEDIQRFGVCDVTAPADYGSAQYLAAHKHSQLSTLAWTPPMEAMLQAQIASIDYPINSCK